MNSNKNIALVVLAGGQSKRFNGIKQLALITDPKTDKPQTMLGRVLEQCLSLELDTYLVLGAEQQKIKDTVVLRNVTQLYNPNWQNGLSSSIKRGIEATQEYAATLLVLADQPLISSAYLQNLCQSWQQQRPWVMATKYPDVTESKQAIFQKRKKFGVPVIFSQQAYAELMSMSGDQGAQQLIQQQARQYAETVVLKKTTDNLVDIDTQVQLNELNILLSQTE